MINDLFSAVQQEADDFAVDDMLGRLGDYARGHFGREEELMELHQFPGLSAHQEAHRGFVHDLDDLRFQSLQPDAVTASDLLRFLKRWWVDHISKTDREYSPYVGHVAVE
jgi:hemerythrin